MQLQCASLHAQCILWSDFSWLATQLPHKVYVRGGDDLGKLYSTDAYGPVRPADFTSEHGQFRLENCFGSPCFAQHGTARASGASAAAKATPLRLWPPPKRPQDGGPLVKMKNRPMLEVNTLQQLPLIRHLDHLRMLMQVYDYEPHPMQFLQVHTV